MMAQTSLDVWFSPVLEVQRDTHLLRIVHFLENSGYGWTACQLSVALGIDLLNVRPRLTDAVKSGVVVEDGVTSCEYCKKQNIVYKAFAKSI